MTDAIAWSNFCSWQAADRESRLFSAKVDANAEPSKVVSVNCFDDDGMETLYGHSLSECWEKFETEQRQPQAYGTEDSCRVVAVGVTE